MKKILVGYDGSDPSKRALEQAADLAKAFGGEVTVVSVVPVHPGRVPVDPWDDRPVHAQELVDARTFLAERGIVAHLLEPAGEPAHAIEEIAAQGGFDTVIVGSRGLGFVERTLQGSVSEHVATHATSTVVIVH